MDRMHETPPLARASVQGNLLDVVASGTVLTGTLSTLARLFNVTPDELLACIQELWRAGWVTVTADLEDRFRIELNG